MFLLARLWVNWSYNCWPTSLAQHGVPLDKNASDRSSGNSICDGPLDPPIGRLDWMSGTTSSFPLTYRPNLYFETCHRATAKYQIYQLYTNWAPLESIDIERACQGYCSSLDPPHHQHHQQPALWIGHFVFVPSFDKNEGTAKKAIHANNWVWANMTLEFSQITEVTIHKAELYSKIHWKGPSEEAFC
jgi:hypothetical protein